MQHALLHMMQDGFQTSDNTEQRARGRKLALLLLFALWSSSDNVQSACAEIGLQGSTGAIEIQGQTRRTRYLHGGAETLVEQNCLTDMCLQSHVPSDVHSTSSSDVILWSFASHHAGVKEEEKTRETWHASRNVSLAPACRCSVL